MGLIKLGIAGAVCTLVYSVWKNSRRDSPAAFANGEGAPGNSSQIRGAGPDSMRDGNRSSWSKVDQASDESFPASDPPATY